MRWKKGLLCWVVAFLMVPISVFAEERVEKRPYDYLMAELSPQDYGGIYYENEEAKEKILHIKPMKESREKVKEAAKKIETQAVKENIPLKIVVDKDNAQYTVAQFGELRNQIEKDSILKNCRFTIYIDQKENKFNLCAWKFTKKEEAWAKEIGEKLGIEVEILPYGGDGQVYFSPYFIVDLEKQEIEVYQADQGILPPMYRETYSYTNKPFEKDGRLMVPVREFSEALVREEDSMDWDEKTRTTRLETNRALFLLTANKDTMEMNGIEVNLERPIIVQKGIMYMDLTDFVQVIIGHGSSQVVYDKEKNLLIL